AAFEFVDFCGKRIDLNTKRCGGFVDQVNGLVGQVAIRDVAVRQRSGGDNRRVFDTNAVMDFVALFQSAQNGDGVFDIRLAHEHDLEATFERWVFLDVSAIFVQGGGADGAQLSAGERGLEHVGSVNRAFASTCADERVKLIDEQDDLALRVFDFFQNGLQAVFELATILRAGEHGAQIKGNDALIFQNFRDVTRDDALSKAFNNGGHADAGLANQHGVGLGVG